MGRLALWGDSLDATARRGAASRRADMGALAADRRAPMVVAVLLAVLAAGQAIATAVSQSTGGSSGPLTAVATSGWLLASFVVLLPSLAATLPLGFSGNALRSPQPRSARPTWHHSVSSG